LNGYEKKGKTSLKESITKSFIKAKKALENELNPLILKKDL
jgi:hypothetical protein